MRHLTVRELVTIIMRDVRGRHQQNGSRLFADAVEAHRELNRRGL